ncbi:prolipoprotein diacylglyceryl transferase [uncultured Microbacterium sp.]|uniref:prolipoprotein diacylglyceryl transferase n=1 Tax=uncultured Microbacterium sp. TaxID=191216 RepID=UPI0025D537C7|nr:prolipoprotein diacylglyceryl transferase [uncultured Microbacterium sp.]
MSFSAVHALAGPVVASIPSPSISYVDIGPLRIHFYALCIIAGVIVAAFMTNARLTRRGAERWVVLDIALPAFVIAIIFARLYHVVTHWDFYFGAGKNIWSIFAIWEGGIAIYGALIGGAIGAWLGCRWTGVRFWTFADALAPGILLAQALGRFGNWFNHELFGLPTDLPWGLEIESTNSAFPAGLAPGTLFHPTFLYEVIWNVFGVCVILWAGHRFVLQWGKQFAIYLVWYSAGRIVWESIRIDPSQIYVGLRTNVWAAIFGVIIGLAIFIVQSRRHTALEPGPYQPGREPEKRAGVQSAESVEYVDVSAPPTSSDADEAKATSTVAAP